MFYCYAIIILLYAPSYFLLNTFLVFSFEGVHCILSVQWEWHVCSTPTFCYNYCAYLSLIFSNFFFVPSKSVFSVSFVSYSFFQEQQQQHSDWRIMIMMRIITINMHYFLCRNNGKNNIAERRKAKTAWGPFFFGGGGGHEHLSCAFLPRLCTSCCFRGHHFGNEVHENNSVV